MSMIYSIICSFVLLHVISAALPPKDVYSAVIINAQDSPIDCQVIWNKPDGNAFESNLFSIDEKMQHIVKEHVHQMDTWEARAAIEEIRCGQLSLKAPFEGVNSPRVNWHFTVTANEIISGEADSDTIKY